MGLEVRSHSEGQIGFFGNGSSCFGLLILGDEVFFFLIVRSKIPESTRRTQPRRHQNRIVKSHYKGNKNRNVECG